MDEDQKPHDARVRKSVLNLTRRLQDLALKGADLPHATDEDRRNLKESAQWLGDAVDDLIKIIGHHDALTVWVARVSKHVPPEQRATLGAEMAAIGPSVLGGYSFVSSAIWAAMTIGDLVLENPITRRELKELEREARRERAAHARQKKQSTVRSRDDELVKLAQPIWDRHPTCRKSAESTAQTLLNQSQAGKVLGLGKWGLEKRLRGIMKRRGMLKKRTAEQSSA